MITRNEVVNSEYNKDLIKYLYTAENLIILAKENGRDNIDIYLGKATDEVRDAFIKAVKLNGFSILPKNEEKNNIYIINW